MRAAIYMRTVFLLLVLLSTAARASDIHMGFDHLSYAVGDAIKLSIYGDAQGATTEGFSSRITWDPTIAHRYNTEEYAAIAPGGQYWSFAAPPDCYGPSNGPPCDIWNQYSPTGLPETFSGVAVTNVYLTALRPGTLRSRSTTSSSSACSGRTTTSRPRSRPNRRRGCCSRWRSSRWRGGGGDDEHK